MQGIRSRRFETLQFETGMKPKRRPESSQLNLFQAQFDQLLNLEHPLCVLARKIDWQRFARSPVRNLVVRSCLKQNRNPDGIRLCQNLVDF